MPALTDRFFIGFWMQQRGSSEPSNSRASFVMFISCGGTPGKRKRQDTWVGVNLLHKQRVAN